MSDSILNGTIQSFSQGGQQNAYKPLSNAVPTDMPGNNSPFFRHKGLKVKITDIEVALVASGLINQAVVLYKEDKEGNRRLVAYIVPNGVFNQMDVTNYLVNKLSSYMIPSLWVCLDKFPLTAHGTIDKNALPVPGDEELITKEHITPRNETEAKLAAIIQNLLGVPSISMQDNFFRLGGGSLQALRVILAIRKEFGFNLDIKCFFVYTTIAGLAGHLQNLAAKDGLFTSTDTKSIFNLNQSIVPIKPGGAKMPLYIVCGGGGSAFTFQKFANMLDEDQPVYGFQQPSDINELEKFPDTIEAIADKYVEEILLKDPHGPYALSGHCIGGAIALEMARKLQSLGKKIKLLVMFDVILSKKETLQPATFKNLYQIPGMIKKAGIKAYLKMDFETFLLIKYPRDDMQYKFNSLKSFVNKFYHTQQENLELKVFQQFEQKFEKAFNNYQVKKYDGDVVVFYAKEHYYFLDKERDIRFKKFLLEDDTKNRWNDYARSVTIHEIDGEHSTIFEPFYSNEFARLLQQHLKACNEE